MTKDETSLIGQALEAEAAGVPFVVSDKKAAQGAVKDGFATLEGDVLTVTDAGREAFEATLTRD